MTLREIVERYEVGKEKKNVIILQVPSEIKDNLESLLIDGYVSTIRDDFTSIFYIYNIPELSKRTGLDFSSKIKHQ